MRLRRLLALALLGALSVACGDAATIDAAPTGNDVEPAARPVNVTTLAEVRGKHLCDVQRSSFATPEAIDDGIDALLAQIGADRATYDTFMKTVETDPDVRGQISAAFTKYCA